MRYTRRCMLGSLAAMAAAQPPRPPRLKSWKPKLGVLARYSEKNLEFLKQEGFAGVELTTNPKGELDFATAGEEKAEKVKASVRRLGLDLAVIQSVQNHIAPDPEMRKRANGAFSRTIEFAGRLGAPFVSTTSGTMPGRPLEEQAAEIVRVYTESYFPLCEKHKVRIVWEPWAGGPNIATGPAGYEALFKAFGDSPWVGIQYDPSHLLWQMMDPIQAMRDFIDKIHAVHLKDTEILWPVLRRVGINPPNNARWWRFRLPGMGAVDWPAFFTVLMEKGYEGPMNIEHEDSFYGFPYPGDDFPEEFKAGLRVALRYLRQFVPA
ncbi:MAG: sugar phosphate isomerase/epimerase [Acidobacteria bacterium]|nr:sugar phosphate isomerase/epimerase [Acidobacteriota bacterium]